MQLHAQWEKVESPKAWLIRCIRNRAYNHIRDHRREKLKGDESETGGQTSDDELPESESLRMEAMAALRQMLDELNETDRQLVILKYFEGLKYREIAEQMGLTIGNVGYRLHHILRQLADQLRSLGFDTIS